ncbi:MAG: lytic transglycosylase domain-containing protein [Candidatus Tumulicola sp.]
MKRTLGAFLALIALGGVLPARACAQSAGTAMPVLYARALQRFNPQLDDDTALDLAATTIAQADRQGLDARLLVAVIAVESRWNPTARSRAGARGLGQLMPQTAESLGVDADDPFQNISGAARQLRILLDRFGQWDAPSRYVLALAAYNAGAGAVVHYGGVPPYVETRAYVRRVITLWHRLAGW